MGTRDKLFSGILAFCLLVSMMSGFIRVEATETRTPIDQVAHNPTATVVPGSNEMLRIQKSIKQTNKNEFTITITADTKEEVKSTGVSVVLLVDQSGSMNNGTPKKIDSLKEAATDFVHTLFPEGEADSPHQLGIVEFHDYGYRRLPLTKEKAKMLSEINQFYAAGETNIVDGLQKAYEALQAAPAGNKKVIWETASPP